MYKYIYMFICRYMSIFIYMYVYAYICIYVNMYMCWLELGSSVPNATKNFLSGGSHNTHPAAVHARVWSRVGTGLSMPGDGAITARAMMAGRQRRLTGHKYLSNKLSHRDVSSCRFFL